MRGDNDDLHVRRAQELVRNVVVHEVPLSRVSEELSRLTTLADAEIIRVCNLSERHETI
jgi:hypothetical protein